MNSKNVYIQTIGCQMNVYDSGRMLDLLADRQYQNTTVLSRADLVIVNTCAIREKAVQKVHSFIGRLHKLKQRNPSLRVVVAGCVAQQEKQGLIERFPHVDIVLGTHAVNRLPEMLDLLETEHGPIVQTDMTACMEDAHPDSCAPAGLSAFVTIMRGCDNFCAYCIVPYVRGREASREPESILNEITRLCRRGVKEITLLGQNVNSYGTKEGLVSFAQLLEMVDGVPGLERIRFVTSHPKDLSDELIASFCRLEKLCNHIHLPVQSGANRILEAMNRRYTREAYLEKVARLRRVSPEIAITTDLIVGFPGETDADFEQTLALMEAVGFDSIYAFAYSDRPNAPAAHFNNKIEDRIKQERLQAILDLQERIGRQKHAALIGRICPVLIEGESKKQLKNGIRPSLTCKELTGRTPENRIVNFEFDINEAGLSDLIGKTVAVKIEKVYRNSLWGTPTHPEGETCETTGGKYHVA